ncbi:transposase [Synergistes jonesii]|uniref:transposase n=1 Tax=Synergistes jonesii TaxID=2754 RepID=UPI00248F0E84|nr:transposase [Synergistes jonesii]
MKQNAKKIQVYFETSQSRFSPFGGMTLFREAINVLRLDAHLDKAIGIGNTKARQAMSDHEIVKSVAAMQILGGDSADGIERIKGDKVLQALICRMPSKSTVHNFLAEFDAPSQEKLRGQGKSFVPARNAHLDGFDEVTKHILSFLSKRVPHTVVTLDQDATFINTKVAGALFNYKKERSFEALNTYCGEYDMMVHSEFIDGNVTPGFNQLAKLKRSLELLPASVEEVRLRSDSAGYQKELLEYCAKGTNKRFKVISFAVSNNVTDQLKETVSAVPTGEWKKIPGKQHQECADINFVSSDLCTSKNSPEYRYVAIREEIDSSDTKNADMMQTVLFKPEDIGGLPVKSLHPMNMNGKVYKVFAVVTNIMSWSPFHIVKWQRGRCGKSEQIHHVLKEELAGGHVVTNTLGANAAWWQITVLAANLLSFIK